MTDRTHPTEEAASTPEFDKSELLRRIQQICESTQGRLDALERRLANAGRRAE